MSVTCRSELRCSLVGFTPVFNPLRSFNKIPGASVAIVTVIESLEIEEERKGFFMVRGRNCCCA